MKRFVFAVLAFTAAGMLFLECQTLVAGNSADTGNGKILGRFVNANGTPSSQAVVQLVPADWDPLRKQGALLTATTDEKGDYALTGIWPGRYNIQALQRSDGARALLQSLTVNDNSVTAPVGTLRKPGSLRVALPDSINLEIGYLYITGTTIASMLSDVGDYAVLDSVPTGIMPEVVYGEINNSTKSVVRYNVAVNTGSVTVIEHPSWPYARTIVLNTSTTGANISETIRNFPVLIRLNSGNFDFSQAKPLGEDMRFFKDDNTALPYEIETWDPAGWQAAVWVKVDTILGRNSTQHFTMYWGNSKAGPASNGGDVFSLNDGNAAVWHLNKSCNDATTNRFNGTNYGAADTAGIIGGCKKFSGNDSIKIASLLGQPGSVTLSAWVRSDKIVDSGAEVITLGDCALLRLDDLRSPTVGILSSYHQSETGYTHFDISTGSYITGTGWHFVALTIDSVMKKIAIYVDGTQRVNSGISFPILYTKLGTSTFLGHHGNKKNIYNFLGCMDEARVNSVAVSADWIKLSYMNQKPDRDMLVILK